MSPLRCSGPNGKYSGRSGRIARGKSLAAWGMTSEDDGVDGVGDGQRRKHGGADHHLFPLAGGFAGGLLGGGLSGELALVGLLTLLGAGGAEAEVFVFDHLP